MDRKSGPSHSQTSPPAQLGQEGRKTSRLIVIEDPDDSEIHHFVPREPEISSDDEDLKTAIALSLQPQDTNSLSSSHRSASAPTVTADDDDDDVVILPAAKRRKSSESIEENNTTPVPVDNSKDLTQPQVFYRLNYIPGLSAQANEGTIGIKQIFQPGARRAILTTYKLDLSWLVEQCPHMLNIPTEVLHGESELEIAFHLPPTLRIRQVKPSVSYGVFHGKIFVIEYPQFLRVAITTANLLEIDFHRKQQSIWMQDFPMRGTKYTEDEVMRDFVDTLSDYLKACGVDPHFLRSYEYKNAKVILISSIPGFHKGEKNVSKYGHMKVRQWLAKEPLLTSPSQSQTEFIALQCSSIGSLSQKWLTADFVASLSAGRSISPRPAPTAHLIWPTTEYVQNCIDGYIAGGSLCCNAKNMKDFMTPLLRRYKPFIPARERIPPHIKTYFRYQTDRKLAWAMTTSANLSTGAWGQVQQNGQQIMLRNFEIGVLFLPSLISDALSVDSVVLVGGPTPGIRRTNDQTAEVSFPLPCVLPPERYSPNDNHWVWDVQHSTPDIYCLRWPPML